MPQNLANSHSSVQSGGACPAGIDATRHYRALVENTPNLVLILDCEAVIRFSNHGTGALTAEQMVGSPLLSWIVPEYHEAFRATLDAARETGEVQAVEVFGVLGQWWAVRLVPMADPEEPRLLMAICTDATRCRAAAQRVHKEQQLLCHLLEICERDRRWASYELHEALAQPLTGALFQLQAFRETHSRDPLSAWKMFDAAARLVGSMISETRRLISALRPPILDEEGIVAAIDYLVMEYCQTPGRQIEFVHDLHDQRLPPALQNCAFRIVQELLSNALRHSQSVKARIEVVEDEGRLSLGVRDWGIGFDPQGVIEGRFGLREIRERARLLGGSVVIETGPGQGTHVLVELPLARECLGDGNMCDVQRPYGS